MKSAINVISRFWKSNPKCLLQLARSEEFPRHKGHYGWIATIIIPFGGSKQGYGQTPSDACDAAMENYNK